MNAPLNRVELRRLLELAEQTTYLRDWADAPSSIITDRLRADYASQAQDLAEQCQVIATAACESAPWEQQTLMRHLLQAANLGSAKAWEEINRAILTVPMPPEQREVRQRDFDTTLKRIAEFTQQVREERMLSGLDPDTEAAADMLLCAANHAAAGETRQADECAAKAIALGMPEHHVLGAMAAVMGVAR